MKMDKWLSPAQGELSRQDLMEMKVHNTLFTTFYVQIVSLMKEKYGVQGAIDSLRQIGEGVATTMYHYAKPLKTKSLETLINYICDIGFYYTVDIVKSDYGLIIQDKNCPICWEGIVEKDIPYCCIIDGFLEKYMSMNHEEFGLTPPVQVRVTKSKATGHPYCEHNVTLL